MTQANSDIDVNGIPEGIARLIGAVIGTAIEPENIRRLANGRMNRPEHRGGENIEWLNSEDGAFWLELAGQVGIDTAVIHQIAKDANAYGYEGIGQGNWDVYDMQQNEPSDEELDELDAEMAIDDHLDTTLELE